MARKLYRVLFGALLFAMLIAFLQPAFLHAQQAPASDDAPLTAPTGQPGVYIQNSNSWQLLSQNVSYRAYVPDSFGSTPQDAKLGELQAVEYPGAHAAVQIHATQPRVCVYRERSQSAPVLVRLVIVKKKNRVLGGGGLHVLTIHKSTHLAAANQNEVVPTTTLPSTGCIVLFQPQAPLAPGEYAVMFGLQNLAIMDFGVGDSAETAK